MRSPRTDHDRHPAGRCRRCRREFMLIERTTACAGGLSQVALRCANCGWGVARMLDPAALIQLERDAERQRAQIARDLRALRLAGLRGLLEAG